MTTQAQTKYIAFAKAGYARLCEREGIHGLCRKERDEQEYYARILITDLSKQRKQAGALPEEISYYDRAW